MGAGPGDPSPLGVELGVQFLTLILFGDGGRAGRSVPIGGRVGCSIFNPDII